MFKKLFLTLALLCISTGAFAWGTGWFPGFIYNSPDYQGDDSTINIASATIAELNVSTLNVVVTGTATYANNSDLLDGYNYDYFVDTVTAQSIDGNKTFSGETIFNSSITINVNGTDPDVSVRGSSVTIYDNLYIHGNLDVLGNTILTDYLWLKSYARYDDNVRLLLGTDLDYAFGSRSGTSVDLVSGVDLRYNKMFGIDTSSATFYNNVYFKGNIDVDGITYSDGVIMEDNSKINDDIILWFGTGGNYYLRMTAGEDSLDLKDILNNSLFKIDETSTTFYTDTYVPLPSGTEAELKLVAPKRAYIQYADTTNNQVVISTGTGVGAFGQLGDFTTLPVGW